MKNLKKVIAGVMASALCFSIAPLSATHLYASAKSSTSGTAEALNINDSVISLSSQVCPDKVSATYKMQEAALTQSEKSYGLKKKYVSLGNSDGWLGASPLSKEKVSFTITVVNNEYTNTSEKIRDLLKLDIHLLNKTEDRQEGSPINYRYDGKQGNNYYYSITKGGSYSNGTVDYEIELPYTTCGDQKRFELLFWGDVSYLKKVSSYAYMVGNASGYYKMSAKYKEVKINLLIKPNTNLCNSISASMSCYYAWLRNLCRYAYSLYDITGIKPEQLYISIGDEEAVVANADHYRISNDQNSVLVSFGPCDYPMIEDTIRDNKMDWSVMHEISHAFSYKGNRDVNGSTVTFAEAYNYSLDDSHTNARGATAMQNCQQLQNIGIKIDFKQDLGTYKNALSNAYAFKKTQKGCEGELPIYSVIDVIGKYANTDGGNGWINLEKYFSNYFNDASSMPVYAVNTAIDYMQSNSPYSYTIDPQNNTFVYMLNTGEAYRFINSLYYLCSNTKDYGKNRFWDFLNNFVTPDVFKTYSAIVNSNYEIWEANKNNIRGDVNNDGYVNENDYTLLRNVINGNSSIKPLGYLNADCYGDYTSTRYIRMNNNDLVSTYRDGFINDLDLKSLRYFLNYGSWPANGTLR